MSPSNAWPTDLGPVICVVGARPNFMKMAPILRAFASHTPAIPTLLLHTGQHYDRDMNDKLFEDLRLPKPDINLEVGSGSHAVQTAEVMRRFEPVVDGKTVVHSGRRRRGTSTLACTLVGVEKGYPRRACRSRPAQLSPKHAGRNQPGAHRPGSRPAVDHGTQRCREPAKRRHFPRAHLLCR